jgi:hypothetical protein
MLVDSSTDIGSVRVSNSQCDGDGGDKAKQSCTIHTGVCTKLEIKDLSFLGFFSCQHPLKHAFCSFSVLTAPFGLKTCSRIRWFESMKN